MLYPAMKWLGLHKLSTCKNKNRSFTKAGNECLSKRFLTAAVLRRKGFAWHNNSVQLSQCCRDIVDRNGIDCALETQLVVFLFLAMLSRDAGTGGRWQ